MSTTILDQAFREVLKHAEALLEVTLPADEFRRRAFGLATAIEGCPLASPEYGLATQRLRNALEYFNQGELGAAGFELQRLRSQIVPLCTSRFATLPHLLPHCPACGQSATPCLETD